MEATAPLHPSRAGAMLGLPAQQGQLALGASLVLCCPQYVQSDEEAPMSDKTGQTTGTTPGARHSSAEEWKDIFRQLEQQVRRESARIVGAPENSDWPTIGRQTDDAARRTAAKAVGVDEGADWEKIGSHVEKTVRSGVATFVGNAPDADWATIGQSVEGKVQSFLQDLFGKKPKTEGKKDETVDPWH
jgi:hypothetical protein